MFHAFYLPLHPMNDLTTIVSTLGFPIVMCLLLWRYMTQQAEKHQSELTALQDTINNNSKVLTELATMIKLYFNGKE